MIRNKNFVIGQSLIHGQGVIANRNIRKGDNIGNGIEFKYFIPYVTENLGVWINHSFNPNSTLVWNNRAWIIVVTRNIFKGEEITLNYENTPWYIEDPWCV